jgi:hypothetical protein
MKPELRKQWLICEEKNRGICFLYGHQGILLDTDKYVKATFLSEQGEKLEELVLTADLTIIDPEQKIRWFMAHVAIMEKIVGRGTALLIADCNDILADVYQKLVDDYVKCQKHKGIFPFHALISGVSEDAFPYVVEFILTTVYAVLRDTSFESLSFEEAKELYSFVDNWYIKNPNWINMGDEILEMLENTYPGTDWDYTQKES